MSISVVCGIAGCARQYVGYCASCREYICVKHSRTLDGVTYCLDHTPQNAALCKICKILSVSVCCRCGDAFCATHSPAFVDGLCSSCHLNIQAANAQTPLLAAAPAPAQNTSRLCIICTVLVILVVGVLFIIIIAFATGPK